MAAFLLPPGINTGTCITADADCDGNPGAPSAALIADGGEDLPVLDKGEFAVLTLNFAVNNTAPLSLSGLQQNTIVVGVPAANVFNAEYLGTFRAAKYGTAAPRNGFGAVIPGVTTTVYNYVFDASSTDSAATDLAGNIGPSPTKPHLEFSITPYSLLPAAINRHWDRNIACISVTANIGSLDDGPIGEDTTRAQHNCPSPSRSPTPTRTPSPTPTPSPTRTPTPTPSRTPTPTPTPSITPTPSPSGPPPCGTRTSQANKRPTFTKQVHTTPNQDAIEVRLCVKGSTANANVGVAVLVLEASADGMGSAY